jgi:hypothetical protein
LGGGGCGEGEARGEGSEQGNAEEEGGTLHGGSLRVSDSSLKGSVARSVHLMHGRSRPGGPKESSPRREPWVDVGYGIPAPAGRQNPHFPESYAPPGLDLPNAGDPRLTPWAIVCRCSAPVAGQPWTSGGEGFPAFKREFQVIGLKNSRWCASRLKTETSICAPSNLANLP